MGGDGDRIEHDEIPKFGKYTPTFNSKLEDHAVAQGWFVEAPTKAIGRYAGAARSSWSPGSSPSSSAASSTISGLIFVAVGLLAGGAVSIAIAQAMPARTKEGAMIDAQLKAYRRTLEATMAQARSMNEVVATAKLDWLDSPTGRSCGASRSTSTATSRRSWGGPSRTSSAAAAASGAYFPVWYGSSALGGGFGGVRRRAVGAPAARSSRAAGCPMSAG